MINKNKKTAFTLIELMIVVGLSGMMAMFGLSTLSHNKLKVAYDESSNKILEFFKEARVYGMSNYIQTGSGDLSSGEYKIPEGGYGFQIEKGIGTGIIALRLFYNNNQDVYFSSGTDVLIQEFISGQNSIFIEKIYGSGSELAFPDLNGTGNILDTNTGTIIFRNMIGDYPDDGSVFISSGDGTNNLKNIGIEFYMLEKGQKIYKRRVIFDRINKSIISQSCKVSSNVSLENCGDSGEGKKWVVGF